VVLLVGTGGTEDAMSAQDLALLEAHVTGLAIQRVETAGQYIQEEAPQAVIDAVHGLRRTAARTH
jgi:hypothetical protein